jgi:prolyl 4-hydroxylase
MHVLDSFVTGDVSELCRLGISPHGCRSWSPNVKIVCPTKSFSRFPPSLLLLLLTTLTIIHCHFIMLNRILPITFLTLLVAGTTTRNYTCPHHLYNVQIFSEDPLIIYIPDFITLSEATHLQSISANKFTSSQVADQTGQQQLASTRTSRSTSLESDKVVQCIEERALQFQGYEIPRTHLEPLQAVQYSLGENYRPHTDWFTSSTQTTPSFGGNRATSFFVYIAASDDIVGGGTQFPLLDAPKNERWCEYVNCDAGWDEGVTFRPIPRNAVFWKNMKGGRGDKRTLHAGLPVQRGEKLGMNIWTREKELDKQFRSEII